MTTLQGNFDIHTNNEHSHCETENRFLQTGWLRSQRNWCRVTHNLLLILDHLNLHLYMHRLIRYWVFHYNGDDARSGFTQNTFHIKKENHYWMKILHILQLAHYYSVLKYLLTTINILHMYMFDTFDLSIVVSFYIQIVNFICHLSTLWVISKTIKHWII